MADRREVMSFADLVKDNRVEIAEDIQRLNTLALTVYMHGIVDDAEQYDNVIVTDIDLQLLYDLRKATNYDQAH